MDTLIPAGSDLPESLEPKTPAADATALLEILARDGHVRQSFRVTHWPCHVGRALDNDIVLSDPHVAPHHLMLNHTGADVNLRVGDTLNGVRIGPRLFAAAAETRLPPAPQGAEFQAGGLRLRLRFSAWAVASEQALAPTHSVRPLVLAGVLAFLGAAFNLYLQSEPEALTQTLASGLLAVVLGLFLWCGAWSLVSKTFTHQARFGWHLRVALFTSVALWLVGGAPLLIAFAMSWPWLASFSFVFYIAVMACALYYHLKAVDPQRPRLMATVAGVCAASALGLTLWSHVENTGLWGSDLYMTHLFPPAFRVARPVSVDSLTEGLQSLQPSLAAKAAEPGHDSGPAVDDGDD